MQNWTLITGASEGLGVEFARLAAKDGHNIILTARSKDKLDALAAELRELPRDVLVVPADLSDLSQAERLWQEASDGRIINMLVNNAGLGRNDPFGDAAGWERELSSINVNMTALTYLMKKAIPHMDDAGGGRILNVASVAGFMSGPGMAVYHATKAYVISLSEAVAEELRGTNVSVTTLCPGATQTNFFADAKMESVRLINLSKPMDADVVAQQGWWGASEGKRIVVPGVMNKLSAFSPRFMPRALLARITKIAMGKT
ncbi:MAG: SDR family oxidoreductase [Paracoccaceae bacterium]